MWQNKHLPALPGAKANEAGVDIVQHHFGTLEELEKAHIYISRLNETIKVQGKELRAQNDRVQRLELALARLQRRLDQP